MRKIVISCVIALATITLAACEEDEDDVIKIDENGNPVNAPEQAAMPNDETIEIVASQSGQSEAEVRQYFEDCVANGGTGIIGGFGQPACATPTPDAGKSCIQDSDCSGMCLAETQTCTTQAPQFGCFDVLPEPGVQATICID